MAFMAGGFVCVLSKTRAMAAGRLKGSSLFSFSRSSPSQSDANSMLCGGSVTIVTGNYACVSVTLKRMRWWGEAIDCIFSLLIPLAAPQHVQTFHKTTSKSG